MADNYTTTTGEAWILDKREIIAGDERGTWKPRMSEIIAELLALRAQRDELLAIARDTAEHFAGTDAPLGERASAAIAKVRNAKPAAPEES